jgi:hypothetical protein
MMNEQTFLIVSAILAGIFLLIGFFVGWIVFGVKTTYKKASSKIVLKVYGDLVQLRLVLIQQLDELNVLCADEEEYILRLGELQESCDQKDEEEMFLIAQEQIDSRAELVEGMQSQLTGLISACLMFENCVYGKRDMMKTVLDNLPPHTEFINILELKKDKPKKKKKEKKTKVKIVKSVE